MWRTSAGPPMSESRATSVWFSPGSAALSMLWSTIHSLTEAPISASSRSHQARTTLWARAMERASGGSATGTPERLYP